MLQGIIILIFMIGMMVLVITKKLPTVLALILTAIGICIIAGVPAMAVDADGKEIGFFKSVLVTGSASLASNIIVGIFCAWLGQVMNQTGITKTMIKKGAELGGDKTVVVQLVLFAISSLLFTTITGLGGTIMVGTIVVPILIAVGVDKASAAITLLLAKGVGATMSAASNKTFASITTVEFQEVYNYGLLLGAIFAVGSIVCIVYRYKKFGKKFAFSAVAEKDDDVDSAFTVNGVLGALAMLTPVIPIVLIGVFKFEIVPAALIGIIWAVLTTGLSAGWNKISNMLVKTMYDGLKDFTPALWLFVAIGVLLTAVKLPEVQSALEPIMSAITPSAPFAIALFFIVLAPLCLYRGPFNLFGMGAGLAALVVSLGLMTPIAAMVGFVSVAPMQQSSCPTNTQNAWTCGFVEEDVTKTTMSMMPFVWPTIAVMVIAGVLKYLV